MEKIYYTIKNGQLKCECKIASISLRQEMESMMGGHGIIRETNGDNSLYICPENEANYFNGIFKMHGFDISLLIH